MIFYVDALIGYGRLMTMASMTNKILERIDVHMDRGNHLMKRIDAHMDRNDELMERMSERFDETIKWMMMRMTEITADHKQAMANVSDRLDDLGDQIKANTAAVLMALDRLGPAGSET